ncbi:MAG: hypothetical protein D6722_13450, partial [Bacteroidetes bacterium]
MGSTYAQFCVPNYSTGPVVGDSIVSFQLGGILGVFPTNPTGYNDYTAFASTQLVAGNTYTATMVNNPTFQSGVGLWIDYNNDTVFSSNELAGTVLLTAGQTGSITFTVPSGTSTGLKRLRMVHNYFSIPTDPCGSYTWGETEDYHVNIQPQLNDDVGVSAIVPPNFDCSIFGSGTPLTVTLANFGLNVADTVLVSYSINAGPTVTDTAFNLASGSFTPFTFSTLAQFPLPNSFYQIEVYTSYALDGNNSNDTLITTILTPFLASLPFTQDFETFTPGSPGQLSGGWSTFNSNASAGWHVETDGIQNSLNTGPLDDHTPGGSIYMFTETSSGVAGDTYSLLTPCIDLGVGAAPRLSFWYHMFGGTMGTLEVHILSGGLDSLVWSLSGSQQTAETDPWLEAIVDLSGFSNQIIQIEWRGIRGTSFESDMAIDDVELYTPSPTDAGVAAILNPIGPGCYGPSEDIIVRIQNLGSAPLDFTQNNTTVTVVASGAGTFNVSTVVDTGTLPVFGTRDIVVGTGDFSAVGVYNLDAYTAMTADTIATNDSAQAVAETLPTFTTLDEDFETFAPGSPGIFANGWTSNSSTSAGWFVETDGIQNSFNTGPLDDNTPGGSIYMYTEISGGAAGTEYDLLSPCIDLTAATSPRMSFFYHMFGTGVGTLSVAVISGNGDSTIWSLSGPQQTAEFDPWEEVILDLSNWAGEVVQVQFTHTLTSTSTLADAAIDDVRIYSPSDPDIAALDVIDPVGATCLGGAEDIVVLLRNEGASPLDLSADPVTVTVDVTGASTQNFSTTVNTGVIGVLDSLAVTVTSVANLATQGFHNFTAYASVAGDTLNGNDTTFGFAEALPVVSAPYTEDFETFISGSPGTLQNGWTSTNSTASFGWHVEVDGVGNSFNTGPIDDHTPGGSTYMFTETSSGVLGDQYSLLSPCIDLTATSGPRLSFWYHMFGGDMGTLEVFAVVNGQTTLLWSLSGQQQTAESDPWLEAQADLAAFAGQTIQLEWRGTRGASFTSDMAIDDVNIFDPPPIDMQALEVLSPTGPGCYGANEEIVVRLRNTGSQVLDFSQNALTVSVDVSGASTQSFSAPAITSGTLGVFDTLDVIVTTVADLSVGGFHNFTAYSVLVGDTLNSNDTTFGFVETLPTFATPFVEDFEGFISGSPGTLGPGWTSTNSTASFGWHVEVDGIQNSLNTGPLDDHTQGGSTYMFTETSSGSLGDEYFLTSPCIDLGSLASPRLSYWYHMFGADMGRLDVFVIADTIVLVDSLVGQQQTAENDPWLEANVDLTPWAGQAIQVQFRGTRGASFTSDMSIDDINIFQPLDTDAGALAVVAPEGVGCFSTSETLTVQIRNFGAQALDFSTDNVTINVDITGPIPQTFSTTVNTGTLPVLQTLDVDVTNAADFSVDGIYDITAYTVLTGDTLFFNDTTFAQVEKQISYVGFLQEDFETATAGFPGTLPVGWTWTPTTGYRWQIEDGPTGSFGTGPSEDHTAAPGTNYAYTEASSGSQGDIATLTSPCVDMTGQATPQLSFWYHFFGANIDSMQIVIRQGGTDSVVQTIVGPQQVAETDPWSQSTIDLAPYGGTIFQVEFRGYRGNGLAGDMAIDDIQLQEYLSKDAGVATIFTPESGCGLTANEDLVLAAANFGSDSLLPADGVFYAYSINGVIQDTLPLTDTLVSGGFTPFTFSGLDLSVPGDYEIKVWSFGLNGDTNFFNDTVSTIITAIPTVATFPYVEDFESGNGGWLSGGAASSWEFGTPQKNTIFGAASGSNAWVTGGLLTDEYNNNENSFVQGPCFDFTNLTDPAIQLSIWYEAEFSWDGAALQVSTNNGATWTTIGAVGDPDNWYTDGTINGNPGGQQTGWSGRVNSCNGSAGWVTARHALTGFGGQSSVLMRIAFGTDGSVTDDGFAFDDVIVYDQQAGDFGITEVLSPGLPICEDPAVPVEVVVRNFGTAAQSNIPVTVNLGGTLVSGTLAGPLGPGESDTLLVGTFNATPGPLSVSAYSTFTGDVTDFNDTLSLAFDVTPAAPLPTVQGDSVCATDSAAFTLTAMANADVILWYDTIGGNIVAQGDTFNTPFLTSTTTYYAAAANVVSYPDFTPERPNFGNVTFSTAFTNGQEFDALSDMRLDSVTVFVEPNGNGGFVVASLIETAGGNTIYQDTFAVSGANLLEQLALGWDIAPGSYEIIATGTDLGAGIGLAQITNCASYDYSLDGIVDITGNTGFSADDWYFFYDWKVSSYGCPSQPVPVTASILAPVDVDLGPDGVVCEGFLLDATDATIVSYEWNGDPTLNTPTITADTSGLYFVNVVNNLGCTGADSVILIVNPAPQVDLGTDSV